MRLDASNTSIKISMTKVVLTARKQNKGINKTRATSKVSQYVSILENGVKVDNIHQRRLNQRNLAIKQIKNIRNILPSFLSQGKKKYLRPENIISKPFSM